MKFFFIKYTYEILLLIVSSLFYLVFKEFPYFNILISTEIFLVLIWIESAVLFKIAGDKTLQVSLFLFCCTLIFAVLGLALATMMSIAAVSLFVFGSIQLLWGILVNRRKE